MKRQTVLLFFTFLLISFSLSAQYYETGQDPANLKWLQIKTGRFTVIYPEKYGNNGIEYARSLDKSYSELSSLFPDRKLKLPVIIHNFTTQSNGYVAWAPKRMEIYPTPEQNTIPLDPVEQLTLHELTHVHQMESLNKGFSKAMSFILGQQFPGAVAALLPLWYMEGQAVFAESVLTGSGRGRSPSFQKYLKAISVEKGEMYKYDKIVNGSFRNFVPDHYKSGFQIVAWTYKKYDPDTWNKALRLTANAPFLVNPINLSLLKNTGLTKRRLFQETFDTLARVWSDETNLNKTETYEIISPTKRKDYINYFCPVKVSENTFVAVKTSLYKPPEFVLINATEKTEEKIQTPGYLNPYFISAANMTVVWVEQQPDPRWENRNYSVIKVMNISDRSIRQLSWKSRYMSASVSPDGTMIAATENTIDNKNNLVLININNGEILKSVPVPGNAYLQRPQWSDNRTKISFISLTGKGEGILSFDLSGSSWETLIPEGTEDYQSTFIRNDSLFFVSSASGTENIYVLPPENKLRRLTSSKFGATDLLIDKKRIVFCDYSFSGNNICFTDLKPGLSDKSNIVKPYFLINQAKLISQSGNREPENIYTPVRYRKWQHLFGFHSWMPFHADIEEIKSDPRSVTPGLTIFSQNQLSTLISSFGYEYTESRHKFHSQITWKGRYPVIESRIDYGERPFIDKPGKIENPSVIKPGIYFTNRISVPLTYSTGKYSQYLRASLSARYENNYLYQTKDSVYDYGQTQVSGRLYFENSFSTAERDVYPRFAQVVDLNFSSYPFDKDLYGSDLALRTAFFFPGILRNNVIRIRYEAEIQPKVDFLNVINFPRGYQFKNDYADIASEEISFLSFDYMMPLVYPDFNLSSFLYLKRIRTGFFYDFARGTNNYYLSRKNGGLTIIDPNNDVHKYAESFSTYGVELISDFHVFRLPYMVSAGIQAAWQEGSREPALGLIFNINIYGMIIGQRSRMLSGF